MEPKRQEPTERDFTPEPENRWYWRNLRSIGFGFEFWPWPWAFTWGRDADVYGGQSYLCLGPFVFAIKYNIGNCSADWPANIGALSEAEAWERVERAHQ